MLNNTEILNGTEQTPIEATKNQPRKTYQKPKLEELGDLRDLTLGASPGLLDSGTGEPNTAFV